MTDRTDSALWKAIWDVLQNSPGITNTWSETATKILTGDLVTAVEELEQPSATLPVESDDFELAWERSSESMYTAKIITGTDAASVCVWLSNGYWYVWRSNELEMQCLDYCSRLADAQEVARAWARDWLAERNLKLMNLADKMKANTAIRKQVDKEMEGLKEIVTNPSGKWVGLKGGSASNAESERFQNEYMLQAVGPKVLQFNLRDVEDFGNHQLCGILMQPNVWFEAQPLSHVQYHIGQVSATKWWFVPIYGGAVGPRRYGEKQREVVAMAQATWEAYQKERARQ